MWTPVILIPGMIQEKPTIAVGWNPSWLPIDEACCLQNPVCRVQGRWVAETKLSYRKTVTNSLRR